MTRLRGQEASFAVAFTVQRRRRCRRAPRVLFFGEDINGIFQHLEYYFLSLPYVH